MYDFRIGAEARALVQQYLTKVSKGSAAARLWRLWFLRACLQGFDKLHDVSLNLPARRPYFLVFLRPDDPIRFRTRLPHLHHCIFLHDRYCKTQSTDTESICISIRESDRPLSERTDNLRELVKQWALLTAKGASDRTCHLSLVTSWRSLLLVNHSLESQPSGRQYHQACGRRRAAAAHLIANSHVAITRLSAYEPCPFPDP